MHAQCICMHFWYPLLGKPKPPQILFLCVYVMGFTAQSRIEPRDSHTTLTACNDILWGIIPPHTLFIDDFFKTTF